MDRARVLVWDPKTQSAGVVDLRDWGYEYVPQAFELAHQPFGAFSLGAEGPLTKIPKIETTLYVRSLVPFEDEVIPVFIAHRGEPEP